jgi:hypothetical protein
MKLSVLFWFYKDFDVCQDRLQQLRVLNADVKIFALFGGSAADISVAKEAVGTLVDDFYAYTQDKDPKWKWQHGEQLIATWYAERGARLEWDTIFVMQWDMLILDSLSSLFDELQPGQILLSGYRPLKSVEAWWPWANPNQEELQLFKELLRRDFNYTKELFACLFIVVCLPKSFLQKYTDCGQPEVGFLEYKIPTLAKVFGIPICENHGFKPWWALEPATKNLPPSQRTLIAVGKEVAFSAIIKKTATYDGKRLLHPFYKVTPGWVKNKIIVAVLSYISQVADIFFVSKQKLKMIMKRI